MDLNILTYLGIMLLAALIAGKIVKQMRLPNVTGYLVIADRPELFEDFE